MSFENDLRQAMRRVPAPEGFAERVMARLNEPRRESRPAPRWRAIAATLLLATILGSWGVHQTIERRRGERAREQVLLALRIAGTQLARAQRAAHDAMAR
jgi:hypothetical protein